MPGALKRRISRIEHASAGTLFLDEIESMPLALQAKLLRVLQDRCLQRLGSNTEQPVDCRVVAATKVDLGAESACGGSGLTSTTGSTSAPSGCPSCASGWKDGFNACRSRLHADRRTRR